jgi:hypothetical protein
MRYLTESEKRKELRYWETDDCADPGVRPMMARLNALDGVCTVQSCIGHVQEQHADGSRYILNGHVEMRLDAQRTQQFYDGMGRLRALPGVDDVMICWRPPYQVCNVWFQPGGMPEVVDMLVEILAPSPAKDEGATEGATLCA